MPFPEQQRRALLDIAWRSIRHGLERGAALNLDPGEFEPPLREPAASFVTLHSNGQLRGCIGNLQASRPLARDVAENAFAAAFRDPRFPALEHSELADLDLQISVLGAPQPLRFDSETDLLSQLRPGLDGLILEQGDRRATFLPAVWETLPDPQQFLQHLKLKAGLPPHYWSDRIRIARYGTECFGEKHPARSGQ
jgi:uncharacterized protein